ncbi:MAG TPA: divalent cation tolerance protein CutA [Candidatus Peribacterales bacterium]|nr:divalent cation tolerance protein CutA [Candidatus Peribacterales bacterium]
METLSPATVPLKITFQVKGLLEGHTILDHLVEERLIAGGTVVQAESLNWVGGEITARGKKEVTAYTTYEKLPIITQRLRALCYNDAPMISQYVMVGEKEEVEKWILRNVRE